MSVNEVEIILKKGFKRRDEETLFITGFHGIGAVGYYVSSYIANQRDARHIGYIKLKRMPVIVKMKENRIGLPFELYEKGHFIVALNEILPDADIVHLYTKKLAEWVINSGFREAVLIGGLIKTAVENQSEDSFRVAYTSSYLEKGVLRKYIGNEIKPMESGLKIVGPLALLLAYFEMAEFPAISILPIATKKYDVDLKAAYTALVALNKYYNANVDLREIEMFIKIKMIEKPEKEVKEPKEEVEETVKSREKYMFYM